MNEPGYFISQAIGEYKSGGVASTLKARDYKGGTVDVIAERKPKRKYVVRRLMPMECCRLQGFPDGWADIPEIKDLTEEEIAFWEENRRQRAEIEGKPYRKISKQRLIDWLNKLHTDSAEYKLWGNGIALPCAADVVGRAARELRKEERYEQ